MSDENAPWSQLVPLGSLADPVKIIGNSFSIGRNTDNDLPIPENKLVSQHHCKITRDEDGSTHLTDTSTNGTQVDGTKVKQRTADLHHGDEIHVVFKKNSAQSNVAFTFELLDKKLTDTLEATQEYESVVVEDPDEPAAKQIKLDVSKPAAGEADEIEETLLCCICQELLHDCVSLQPCMHTFCAGCFSQWVKTSKRCPTCRKKATSVAQNHILRNLIDVYLKAHPNKQRPEDELEVLNTNNIIKKPIMDLSKVIAEYEYDDEDDEDVEEEDYDDGPDDDDDDDDGVVYHYGAAPFHLPLNINAPVCRECPGYDASRAGYRHLLPPAPTHNPPAGGFQCTPNVQQHLVCYCCMEMFPDRRTTPDTAPVTCDGCAGTFCHLYWTCHRPGCNGCITKLKDMNVDQSALNNILLQNIVESSILKDYLNEKSLTATDLVTQTCTRLDNGDFQLNNDFNCNFSGKNIKGDSVVCHRCAAKALRQLAYFYRRNISRDDLPDAVTRKEDCYWGKNCRTQKKPAHAAKWNHVCEQTRTS